MDVLGLDLAEDALDLFLSLLIFVTRVAVPFFTFLLFLSPFLINLDFGTSIFLGTSFLLIALLVLVKDVLDVLFFELVPTFSLLRILVALLTYYKPYWMIESSRDSFYLFALLNIFTILLIYNDLPLYI